MEQLKSDNQRLKDENGALVRVISKLSKWGLLIPLPGHDSSTTTTIASKPSHRLPCRHQFRHRHRHRRSPPVVFVSPARTTIVRFPSRVLDSGRSRATFLLLRAGCVKPPSPPVPPSQIHLVFLSWFSYHLNFLLLLHLHDLLRKIAQSFFYTVVNDGYVPSPFCTLVL